MVSRGQTPGSREMRGAGVQRGIKHVDTGVRPSLLTTIPGSLPTSFCYSPRQKRHRHHPRQKACKGCEHQALNQAYSQSPPTPIPRPRRLNNQFQLDNQHQQKQLQRHMYPHPHQLQQQSHQVPHHFQQHYTYQPVHTGQLEGYTTNDEAEEQDSNVEPSARSMQHTDMDEAAQGLMQSTSTGKIRSSKNNISHTLHCYITVRRISVSTHITLWL